MDEFFDIQTIEQLLPLDLSSKNILIIGHPASGKTYLSNAIKSTLTTKVIHTDDYLKYGYQLGLYALIDELRDTKEPTLIEGTLGYRLLRKGVQLDLYYPDIVIELIISEQQRRNIYNRERDARKLKFIQNFNNTHNKILNDYFKLPNKKKPTWIKIQNNWVGRGYISG